MGVLLAMVGLVCASPSTAHASCSQYAVENPHWNGLSNQLDILGVESQHIAPTKAPTTPRPCSGLLCSGKSALPGVISIPIDRPLEAVAFGWTAPSPVGSEGRLLANADLMVRAVIEAASIERPPR